MKTIVLILAIVALAAAVPKPTKLHYRNLFKQPVGEIKPGYFSRRLINRQVVTTNLRR
jgi:hypothetical protein